MNIKRVRTAGFAPNRTTRGLAACLSLRNVSASTARKKGGKAVHKTLPTLRFQTTTPYRVTLCGDLFAKETGVTRKAWDERFGEHGAREMASHMLSTFAVTRSGSTPIPTYFCADRENETVGVLGAQLIPMFGTIRHSALGKDMFLAALGRTFHETVSRSNEVMDFWKAMGWWNFGKKPKFLFPYLVLCTFWQHGYKQGEPPIRLRKDVDSGTDGKVVASAIDQAIHQFAATYCVPVVLPSLYDR